MGWLSNLFRSEKSDRDLFLEGAGRLVQLHLRRASPNEELRNVARGCRIRGVPVGDWEIITRPIPAESQTGDPHD